MIALDHIVIGARDLAVGVEYIHDTFGIPIPFGGAHPLMGTHNHLMALDNNTFIEVIAIDPNAPPPARSRWFGLDDPRVQAQIARSPGLLTWVVRTDNIEFVRERAQYAIGEPTHLSRGTLHWQFALHDDGRLLADGALPYVLEWQTSPLPVTTMLPSGWRIESITLTHPAPDSLNAAIRSISMDAVVSVVKHPKTELQIDLFKNDCQVRLIRALDHTLIDAGTRR